MAESGGETDRKSGWVENMDRKGGWAESMDKMEKVSSSCTGPGAPSVYDFSCKPSSPLVPLNKSRKDLRSPRQAKEDKSAKQEEIRNPKSDPKGKPGDKKSNTNPQSVSHTGYNATIDPNYDARQFQDVGRGPQHANNGTLDASRGPQDPNRGNQSRQLNLNYSHPATTYHPGTQQSLPRHTYMTPHYQYHQMGVPGAPGTPGVPNQQTNSYSQHAYSHVPVTNPEMKNGPSFHQDPKYSCSSHSSSASYPPTNLHEFNSR